jgi:hypothetical protein
MTLLALFDAADPSSTISRGLDIIYKSTGVTCQKTGILNLILNFVLKKFFALHGSVSSTLYILNA